MLNFEINIQRQVISLGLDDHSLNSLLPHAHGGQFGTNPDIWRKSVIQFIHDMLTAGLIVPLSGVHGYERRSIDEIISLLRDGDLENKIDVELLWNVMYFDGTSKLRNLLKSLNLDNWESLSFELSPVLGTALAEMSVVSPQKPEAPVSKRTQ